jgi:hypothetical protein
MGTGRPPAKGNSAQYSSGWGQGQHRSHLVIVSEAKQSIARHNGWMDCFVALLLAMTEKGSGAYPCALIFSAAFGAKYVRMPSAPARLKPSRLSIIARSPSIQPRPAAAAIIAYSPDT